MHKIIRKKHKIYELKFLSFLFFYFILFLISCHIFNIKKTKYNKTQNSSSISFKNADNKHKIIAISYGNKLFKRQLKANKKSALEIGNVDEYYNYGPDDIDKDFKEKNKDILSIKRGNGLWLWKPYFINKTIIEKMEDGDYLIYTDAAVMFMNSSQLLIDFLKLNNADMWMFRLTYKESKYSKRDAFILIGVDMPFYSETNQYQAGIQIYRKNAYTIRFVQEWLFYCKDKRIVSDNNNTLGKNNYPGFIENRHDQTALSLLIKKYGEVNSGKPNFSLNKLNQEKIKIMPIIFCIYRKMHFKDYYDLKSKCSKLIELQKKFYS